MVSVPPPPSCLLQHRTPPVLPTHPQPGRTDLIPVGSGRSTVDPHRPHTTDTLCVPSVWPHCLLPPPTTTTYPQTPPAAPTPAPTPTPHALQLLLATFWIWMIVPPTLPYPTRGQFLPAHTAPTTCRTFPLPGRAGWCLPACHPTYLPAPALTGHLQNYLCCHTHTHYITLPQMNAVYPGRPSPTPPPLTPV